MTTGQEQVSLDVVKRYIEQDAAATASQSRSPVLTPAAVTDYDPATRILTVELDSGGAPITAANLTFGVDLIVDDRVMVQFVEPHGVFVTGIIKAPRDPVVVIPTTGGIFTITDTIPNGGAPATLDLIVSEQTEPMMAGDVLTVPAGRGGIWALSCTGLLDRFDVTRYDLDLVTSYATYRDGGFDAEVLRSPAAGAVRLHEGDTVRVQGYQTSGGTAGISGRFEAWLTTPITE